MTAPRFPRFAARACLSAVGAASLAVLAVFPATANHSWSTYHWSRTGPLSIRLGDNVGTAWDAHLQAAAVDWSRAAALDTVVASGGKDPVACAPTYGRVEVCNASYGATGWLGLGQVWSSGGHVVQGTAKLNDTYFSQVAYNTPAWRRSVMCQEIGHTLGLDHQDVDMSNRNLGSCMDYSRDPSGTKGTNGTLNNERANQHDLDQLALIYNHLDSTQLTSTKPTSNTSTARAPRAPAAAPPSRGIGHVRSEWGRSVATDRRGRPRVFVRDLGGDTQVTTFVIWAEDAAPEHWQDGHGH
ncbi:hypothetical protein GRI75_04025 [Altererythrobacter soli]|uniref:Peptidase M10 metallopeptidase domain-containing protein n=1 Tax=Croceibacterium soli TaxID=1739690 RepID=A0A6I4UT79_9SPHN|nr:hypothetical protein [Croceibacterium soli]MXP40813.1 hypothetical protein [Croceibacterium soli]